MSRIGKHPVAIPDGVQVTISGQKVSAKGKLGQLDLTVHDEISVARENGTIVVKPRSNSRAARTMWATSRTLVNNLVTGVNEGFSRRLQINGVGYKAAVMGKELVLQLGYSHDIRYPIPEGLKVECERPTAITIFGADKRLVGQVASEIRAMRKPEPFKGKGVKYAEERLRRKEGKKK